MTNIRGRGGRTRSRSDLARSRGETIRSQRARVRSRRGYPVAIRRSFRMPYGNARSRQERPSVVRSFNYECAAKRWADRSLGMLYGSLRITEAAYVGSRLGYYSRPEPGDNRYVSPWEHGRMPRAPRADKSARRLNEVCVESVRPKDRRTEV